VPDHVPF